MKIETTFAVNPGLHGSKKTATNSNELTKSSNLWFEAPGWLKPKS